MGAVKAMSGNTKAAKPVEPLQLAQLEFQKEVKHQLDVLQSNGMARAKAVALLLERITKGPVTMPNIPAIATMIKTHKVNQEDAIRALIVRAEIRRLQKQGLDTLAAVQEITRRLKSITQSEKATQKSPSGSTTRVATRGHKKRSRESLTAAPATESTQTESPLEQAVKRIRALAVNQQSSENKTGKNQQNLQTGTEDVQGQGATSSTAGGVIMPPSSSSSSSASSSSSSTSTSSSSAAVAPPQQTTSSSTSAPTPATSNTGRPKRRVTTAGAPSQDQAPVRESKRLKRKK